MTIESYKCHCNERQNYINSTFCCIDHFAYLMSVYSCESVIVPPLGDKVSMLTHIYPHKARRKIEVIICKITRLTAHFKCGLMSDLLICTCL